MMKRNKLARTAGFAAGVAVVFALFAFRAAEWTKGVSPEFVVYGQTGTGGGGTTGPVTKVIPLIPAGNLGNTEPRNYATIIEIINTNTTAVTLNGNFYNADGTASTLTYTTNVTTTGVGTNLTSGTITGGSFTNLSLPAGSILVIGAGTTTATTPAAYSQTWASINSTGAITVAGFFELRHSQSKALYTRVGIPASAANMTTFVIPRLREPHVGDGINDVDTGFVLVNTGTAAATITGTIYDVNGKALGTGKVALLGLQSYINFSQNFFTVTGESKDRQYQYMEFTASPGTLAAVAVGVEGGSLSGLGIDTLK
jgi:hypothetical protein